MREPQVGDVWKNHANPSRKGRVVGIDQAKDELSLEELGVKGEVVEASTRRLSTFSKSWKFHECVNRAIPVYHGEAEKLSDSDHQPPCEPIPGYEVLDMAPPASGTKRLYVDFRLWMQDGLRGIVNVKAVA